MQPFEIRVPAEDNLPELLLSIPTVEDAQRITQVCQDPEITRWTSVPSPYTLADAEFFCTQIAATKWENEEDLTWAIREIHEGESTLVGMIDIVMPEAGLGEIGFWMAADSRGHGTLHRAANKLLDVAFDPDGPLKLTSMTWKCLIIDEVPNWTSWRVAWRLGFVKQGLSRKSMIDDGTLRDGWAAQLLASDPRQPQAPWDGPVPGRNEAHTQGLETPLVPHNGVGEREGDDPEALVRRFHHVYGLPIHQENPSLERDSLHMRMSLIGEEFAELVGSVYGSQARNTLESAYQQAVSEDDGTRDLVETADALADLVYVVYGMALETGIDLAAVLAEVQRSNMSKLGPDGKPIYREDGKVLKGPGYFPPNVAGVLGLED